MRKQDKIILWPVYFDLTKTRVEGRRVPKGLAIPTPKLEEIQKAVERIGIQPEVVSEAQYPSASWQKAGLITIPKMGSKTQIIRRVAKELLNIRAKG